ncbi:hypothetical protein C493_15163 [Natronolimnohabitans innermongolicus JCM 12255]|uniref:Uncharacterized protein n=2 Tax=Natronolimnohabitans innermongolicus TaxID=253107 RepID=L9WX62_9EURY|nr:hypothetical protein C493_15163 [Natronolimnohabitans innermongolicus JCM 12255]
MMGFAGTSASRSGIADARFRSIAGHAESGTNRSRTIHASRLTTPRMADQDGRRLEYAVLLLTALVILAAALIVLEVTTIEAFDVGSVPRWTAVAGAVLAALAIGLPAYLLSKWQGAQNEARDETETRRRRRRKP